VRKRELFTDRSGVRFPLGELSAKLFLYTKCSIHRFNTIHKDYFRKVVIDTLAERR